jgi:ribosomal protein S18
MNYGLWIMNLINQGNQTNQKNHSKKTRTMSKKELKIVNYKQVKRLKSFLEKENKYGTIL